ncbi:MAG: hypothetical protein KDH18_22265, partial [Rhodoferax sp.]|nr:hypothetical protein [Rhodoferax sp.]
MSASPAGTPPTPDTTTTATTTTLPAALHGLLQAQAYPGGAVQPPVRLVETHISWVLLAGQHAYKIKKPVKLPFLDFSTLALRKRYCEDELRLNRRFAPDIYLGVVAIRDVPSHGLRVGGPNADDAGAAGAAGPVVEYAVQMLRFDEADGLDRVAARGALTAAHMSE